MIYKELLVPYNPWWEDGYSFERLPVFHRPAFEKIYSGIMGIPQIISITGPRRVGKSTIIQQCIRKLILEGIEPERIIYYPMDDPALYRSDIDHDKFFDALMDEARKKAKDDRVIYIFLDEVQRFERWELFLKKYYELHYPVRFTISGSASSPIFRKSRESLLGRIKDYHLLPFSFREYMLFQNKEYPAIIAQLEDIHKTGEAIMGMFAKHPEYAGMEKVNVPEVPAELRGIIQNTLNKYLLEGGFPEVWTLPGWEEKQSYLFSNQVEKVITEDLVLAVELRKPEALKRFYISLLESPGIEINFDKLSKTLHGITRQSLEKYFPMLEMTDLIQHVGKFSKKLLKLRRGNIKCYLTDLALRNAVLRIQETLLEDAQTLGLYAENLAFNALRRWEGTISISYYREKESEIDFIVHLAAGRFLPVEVKYKQDLRTSEFRALASFAKRYGSTGIVVTKKWDDFGKRDGLFYLPLAHFLLLFD
jgi:predicted AAA+ superfamily ATPase